jgi:hypothetical protein
MHRELDDPDGVLNGGLCAGLCRDGCETSAYPLPALEDRLCSLKVLNLEYVNLRHAFPRSHERGLVSTARAWDGMGAILSMHVESLSRSARLPN